jgi:NADH-quinone oxidoreductase subunit G
MPRDLSKLALFSPYPAQLAKWAGASATHLPGGEAALIGALLGLGEAPAGMAEAVEWTRKRLSESQKIVVILGANVLNHPEAAAKAKQLVEKTGAKVLCMTPAANARGLEALGLYPAKGGAAWTETGPQAVYYGYIPTEAQLRSAQFRVLHLTHRNALTDRYADVILPNQTPYEKRGQTVNLEGRVLPLEPVSINNGEADGAVAALAVLAEAIGVKPPLRLVRQASKTLAEKFKLPAPIGRWNVKPASFPPSTPYPQSSTLYLRPTMWRREQLTGAVANVVRVELEASPETARANGLVDGATVELDTPSGIERVMVKVLEGLPSGVMYFPALGNWAGRRVEARILVGGEA